MSGTSMATPIVTGAVVNMIAVEAIKNPNKILTPKEIKDRLRSDAENSYADKMNKKISMNNFDYGLCWKYPSEFTLSDCFTWWLRSTLDAEGNLIALSSVRQTYPYSVYIGKYFNRDATLISNYSFPELDFSEPLPSKLQLRTNPLGTMFTNIFKNR